MNAWWWEPGSGNVPVGYHFESYNGRAVVVRDGMTVMGHAADGQHKGELMLLDRHGTVSPASSG